MDAFVHDAAAFIARNGAWAGPLLGLLTFGESLVLVGAFVPATALMVAAGALTATGVLPLAPVLFWCCAGAMLGEAVSYFLGRRAGPALWRHPVLRSRRRTVAKARLFFRRYGVASIFLGRFLGPIQAFVPLVAGVTRMTGPRFHVANVASALIWAPVMLAPGYLAGGGLAMLMSSSLLVPSAVALAVLAVGGALAVEPLVGDRQALVLRPA